MLILSAPQLCWLGCRSELECLRDLLSPLSEDIRVSAHVDAQARVLTRVYAGQILDGRASSLDREVALAGRGNWWENGRKSVPEIAPRCGVFAENQAAPFWLDYARLVDHWASVFGAGKVRLRSVDPDLFAGAEVTEQIRTAFGIDTRLD